MDNKKLLDLLGQAKNAPGICSRWNALNDLAHLLGLDADDIRLHPRS